MDGEHRDCPTPHPLYSNSYQGSAIETPVRNIIPPLPLSPTSQQIYLWDKFGSGEEEIEKYLGSWIRNGEKSP